MYGLFKFKGLSHNVAKLSPGRGSRQIECNTRWLMMVKVYKMRWSLKTFEIE